jgi:uroporphyrin-III C-methyltransferase
LNTSGKVFLVGAGPGDPELLTLKAAKVLRSAEVVLHDELVSPEILRLIPSTADVVNVGKRSGKPSPRQADINQLLVQYALLGFRVVRLKGGDPFIFGRGGEEMEALRQAQIEVEIVPGVTAALGAAATVQVPLTHRELSSTLILVTGSSTQSDHIANWPDRLPSNATVVVYMPGDLGMLQNRLLSSGVSPVTPCAIISGATTESEKTHIGTVSNLAGSPAIGAPKLVVIGEVVRFADQRRLHQQFSNYLFSQEFAKVSSSNTSNPLESAE